jgi:hypothetical protein
MTYDGFEGTDTINCSLLTNPVQINLNLSKGFTFKDGSWIQFSNILNFRNIVGSPQSDILIESTSINTFHLSLGNDTLNGSL